MLRRTFLYVVLFGLILVILRRISPIYAGGFSARNTQSSVPSRTPTPKIVPTPTSSGPSSTSQPPTTEPPSPVASEASPTPMETVLATISGTIQDQESPASTVVSGTPLVTRGEQPMTPLDEETTTPVQIELTEPIGENEDPTSQKTPGQNTNSETATPDAGPVPATPVQTTGEDQRTSQDTSPSLESQRSNDWLLFLGIGLLVLGSIGILFSRRDRSKSSLR